MLAGPVLRARLLFKFRRTHDPARVRPPGEYSSYSNYGATLAGYIVERVSGLPYDDYVEQNILTPLNMAHSTSRQPVPAAFAADLSEGYEFIDEQYQAQPFETVNPCRHTDVVCVFFTTQIWLKKLGSLLWRIHYMLVSLAGVGFIWFLYFWNLLGKGF